MGRVVFVIMLAVTACGRGPGFIECETNSNCNLAASGLCEVNSRTQKRWCTYACEDLLNTPAPSGCESGRCWSDLDTGDGLSGTCVEEDMISVDAGVDASPIDACVPKTCEDLAANCGEPDDGCGGTLSCGTCILPLTCGGAGMDNRCGGTCVSGEWNWLELDDSVNASVSFARVGVGTNGTIHIVHGANREVHHAYRFNDGSPWVVGDIIDTDVATLYLDMVVDSLGGVHAFYRKADYELSPAHAYFSDVGASWAINNTVVTGFGGSLAGAIDGDDGLHLVYVQSDGGVQRSYQPAGGNWTLPELILDYDQLAGVFVSVATDSAGGVHVVHRFASTVRYATRLPGGSWSVLEIANDARTNTNAAIAVDAAGVPHIAYTQQAGLAYAHKKSGVWTIARIDDASGTGNIHLKFDPSKTVAHIAYTTNDGLQLYHMWGSAPLWSKELVGSAMTADDLDLVVDTAGGVHVTLSDRLDSNQVSLRYSYRCP